MTSRTTAGTVVVGTDGSDGARRALVWAVAHAARAGLGVCAVRVYDDPETWSPAVRRGLGLDGAVIRGRVLEAVRREVTPHANGVPVRPEALPGSAPEVLAALARDAAMLVVGHRGLGAWRSVTVGSVGLGVLFRATCPVTVVRPGAGGPVVVGIDGSDGACRALRHGAAEAARRGTRVLAVAGAAAPPSMASSYHPGVVPLVVDYRRAVEARARDLVERVVAEHPDGPAIELRCVDEPGAPAVAGVAQEVGADLVVVGHSGRGPVSSRLLGSVGYELVLRAPCPLTVVPGAPAAPAPAPAPAPAAAAAPAISPRENR